MSYDINKLLYVNPDSMKPGFPHRLQACKKGAYDETVTEQFDIVCAVKR